MIIISHRGNLTGSDPETENRPDQIIKVLEMGFDVEVDVWFVDDEWYLGHDEPTHRVPEKFLEVDGLWLHAKSLEAVERLSKKDLNVFWHEDDAVTMTRHGYIWCYPNKEVDGGIAVDHGQLDDVDKRLRGICTDYPLEQKFPAMHGMR